MKRLILAAALLGTAIASPASAASIVGLYNTGVQSGGTQSGAGGGATTGNGADPHWQFGFNGGVSGVFPIGPWLAETSESRWLTPTGSAGDDAGANTDYVFTLTFNLLGYTPGSASFAGRFAADNGGTLALNGTTIGTISDLGSVDSFATWTSFSAASNLFVNGANVLTLTVQNGPSGGPAGGRVEFLSSNVSAVPEPATWAMMLMGFSMVGFGLRASRKGKVSTKVAYA